MFFKSIQPSMHRFISQNIRLRYFENTFTIETGTSDFYKFVVTVLKMFYVNKNL